MARPKSSVVAARDHEIFALWRQGQSLQELAEQFNISPGGSVRSLLLSIPRRRRTMTGPCTAATYGACSRKSASSTGPPASR